MLEPLDAGDWGYVPARHLLNRAGFGGSPDAIRRLAAMGPDQAVEAVMGGDGEEGMERPDWAEPFDFRALMRSLRRGTEAEKREGRRAYNKEQRQRLNDLTERWVHAMATARAPLREKMTLFLHGHFATSAEKVGSTYKLWRQNDLFRRLGLGDFRELTKAVSRDPAMLQYLDGVRNKKGRPNENFAREVMELFTLGEGNYSEADITEAARAFTGYRIDDGTEEFVFVEGLHDDTPKTVLGRTGAFTGDEVIDILFEQPAAAEFLAGKLWRFFVAEDPDPRLVKRLAAVYRSHGYGTRDLLRVVFRSREFYAPEVVGRLVKSPAQWLVQAARELECPVPGGTALRRALEAMGQVLFRPPNVKGWDGGRSWINASTLLVRYNLAAQLCGAVPGGKGVPEVDIAGLAGDAVDGDAAAVVDALGTRFYGVEPGGRERQAHVSYWIGNREDPEAALRGLAQLMMSTPRYQLC